ncbi:hypothetical protein KBY97_13480 [Synechococcus sp. ATX 2A4]|uniref:hypothetical protein n=1 Tax=Synechococcus sp. ATX 2A4 TaxID=2823727 RepID=UPI0020CDBA88|nr:hypothetical protein [Synechococcus sp. ATX 2A4]MCP9886125.1 hypothetical protein [Synechococcus sp. ATX 2A4]
MPTATLLTLFDVDAAEQSHFLLPRSGLPKSVLHWLVQVCGVNDQEHHRQAREHTEVLILQEGGKRLAQDCCLFVEAGGCQLEGETWRCLLRYLVTFHARRRRILVSAWRRPDTSSAWQRLLMAQQPHDGMRLGPCSGNTFKE